MKKNVLLILATSALLVLAGCSASPAESSSNVSSEASSEKASSESTAIVSNETSSSETALEPSSESESKVSSESQATDASSESSEASEPSESSESVAKEYAISAESDEGAKVILKTDKAPAGSEVHFVVTLSDGFSIGEISARAGSSELDLVVGLDGDYSFTMPSRGVAIKVTTSRKSFKLSTSDGGGFLKSVTQKKVGSSSYVDLDTVTEESEPDEEGETSTSSYKAAQYGAEILLTFNTSVSNYDLTGISVNGVATSLKAGTESYSFVMEAKDTSVSITYSYKGVAFELVNSEHITLSFYSDSEGKEEVKDSYTPYSTAYLKATLSDDGYGVKAITYSYTSGTSTTSKDITSQYVEGTGLYYFTYPMTGETVTITVTEYDLHAYEDAPFIGEYMNLDLSYGPIQDYDSFTEKSSMKILGSGDLVYARTESSVNKDFSVSSYEDNEGTGLIKLEEASSYSPCTVAYSKNLIVYDTYLDNAASSSNYLMVGLKKEKTDGDYSVKATQFKIGDITYALACFYEGDTSIENVLIERAKDDYAKNTIHFGASVEMLEGDFVNEDKTIFRVKDGDTTLLSIGYTGEGAAKNRVTLGEEYGTYTDSDGKSLYLNGSGSATYDGASYGYILGEDGTTITLSSNDGVVTGTIDKTNMSFTVNKKEEATMPWKGKTYKGTPQWSDSDSEAQFPYQAVFSDTENKVTWNEIIGGRTNYSAEATYTVENGNVIKTEFYTSGYKPGGSGVKTISLTYIADGDYFLANGGYTGAYFKNTKLTLVS